MEFITSSLIGIGLAMDAFAVSLGIGSTPHAQNHSARFRLSFHFGFFQGLMTVLGWLAGSSIAQWISTFDHWVAFALLAYVGSNMIRSGFHPETATYLQNPSRGKILMMLCIATSLDAMAVGLSMAMIGTPIWMPAALIAIITFGLSAFGLQVGNGLGQRFGKRMEIIGGLILLFIGIRILIQHLFLA
jgi:putative Mn2+ efflux pump MntP